MDYAKTKLAVAIAVLACAVATAVPAAAQQQVVLPPPILVTSQSMTISNSPGDQQNPTVSKGFIGFESGATPLSSRDLLVYDIANNTLYQVNSTPAVDESLNNISVLDNGDIRVVWAANDGASGDQDIHGLTFTPISHQVSYQICLLHDPSVAKKSGS